MAPSDLAPQHGIDFTFCDASGCTNLLSLTLSLPAAQEDACQLLPHGADFGASLRFNARNLPTLGSGLMAWTSSTLLNYRLPQTGVRDILPFTWLAARELRYFRHAGMRRPRVPACGHRLRLAPTLH